MPEVGDDNIEADILLPRGDKMMKSHVVAWSGDANGNVMSRAHTKSILDARMYQLEFAGGKGTDLTANIVVESMYAQYDADKNEYLLLVSQVDYHKDYKVISFTDQQSIESNQ